MRTDRLATVFVVATGALTSGCVGGPYGRMGYWGERRWALVAEVATPQEYEAREALVEAESAPTYIPEIPHEPPRITSPEPVHVAFDSAAALAALHEVDVSECALSHAPLGYGHARVTFEGEGDASRVVIDSPSGMTRTAVDCIGKALAEVSVPAFDGASITVGTSYLVK